MTKATCDKCGSEYVVAIPQADGTEIVCLDCGHTRHVDAGIIPGEANGDV